MIKTKKYALNDLVRFFYYYYFKKTHQRVIKIRIKKRDGYNITASSTGGDC